MKIIWQGMKLGLYLFFNLKKALLLNIYFVVYKSKYILCILLAKCLKNQLLIFAILPSSSPNGELIFCANIFIWIYAKVQQNAISMFENVFISETSQKRPIEFGKQSLSFRKYFVFYMYLIYHFTIEMNLSSMYVYLHNVLNYWINDAATSYKVWMLYA